MFLFQLLVQPSSLASSIMELPLSAVVLKRTPSSIAFQIQWTPHSVYSPAVFPLLLPIFSLSPSPDHSPVLPSSLSSLHIFSCSWLYITITPGTYTMTLGGWTYAQG